MSGPTAEFSELHTRVRFAAFYWPIELLACNGEAQIACVFCLEPLVRVFQVEKPTSLCDLNAKVEAHMTICKEVPR